MGMRETPPPWHSDPRAPLLVLVIGLPLSLILWVVVIWLQTDAGLALLRHWRVLFFSVVAIIILGQAWRYYRRGELQNPSASKAGVVLPKQTVAAAFESLASPRQRPALTLDHLERPLLITGQPGVGKTTLLRSIGRAAIQKGMFNPGRTIHTITFDANRSLAEFIAQESHRYGRRTIVFDLAAPNYLTPYQFPRQGAGGVEAAVEAIRQAWFPFSPEVPAQMRDSLLHVFRLLAASNYGLEQSLRLLRSPAFLDHAMRQGAERLNLHTRTWVDLIQELPRSEWYRKFWSSLARLFALLENEGTRLALAGPSAGFNFEHVNDPVSAGPGIDVIITARGAANPEDTYFAFGILLSDLVSVLRTRLEPPPRGRWPEILVMADELGHYGGAEALLNLLASGRNVEVKLAGAVHSLKSLKNKKLQEMLPVLAVNRIAGAETGPGADLTTEQLAPYDPYLVATRGPDGRPTRFWSPEEQRSEFRHRLQNARDFEFAVRFLGQSKTVWTRFLKDDQELFPNRMALAEALAAAARASGRPVQELQAALDRQNAELDKSFGPIDYRPGLGPTDPDDQDWHSRPDSDFAPSFWS